MKSIFTFLSLSFLLVFGLSPAAHAQEDAQQRNIYQGRASLSISSFNSSNLRLIVDGNTYNISRNNNNDDFMLNNLNEGNHSIKIWKMPNRSRGGVYNSQAVQVLYDATVYLRSGYQTDFVVNRFGRIFKDEQYGGVGNNNPNQPTQNQYPYNQQMTNENFTALKATVNNESFDNSRINIIKQAAQSNYFTAAQVKELMQIFSFDNSKLDIAKTLYARTVDKQNYFMVNDAFSYSSSKDELNKWISKNP